MPSIDPTTCPYCEEDFDTEHDKGVHMAENHVDTESSISKSKGQHDPDRNILKDKWSGEKDRGEA